MIPHHEKFLAAIAEKKKVSVRFFSKADNGVLDRIFAPMNYGPGSEHKDELNRYWLWDYAPVNGVHTLGLLPAEIVELSPLGESFDASVFAAKPAAVTTTQEP